MPGQNLCLLALDGGGVRGLSSLQIVKQLMETINPDQPPKPCEYFDMIGGTSTGGLIAIMLGRLHMDVDECIEAYIRLADRVFKKTGPPLNLCCRVQSRFNTKALEQEIKGIVRRYTGSENSIFKDEEDASCKVFVCATRMENARPMQFKSYPSRSSSDLLHSARIWEVARATSAAPSFFDPIQIGRFGEGFSDGGTGANNPVHTVWNEAQHTFIREGQSLEGNLKCLVSIGTGKPSLTAFGNNLQTVAHTLIRMATETQNTANLFSSAHRELGLNGQYYRFNVDQGLEGIGLEDAAQAATVMAATRHYLESTELERQMQNCGKRLKRRGPRAQSASSPGASPPRNQNNRSPPALRPICRIS